MFTEIRVFLGFFNVSILLNKVEKNDITWQPVKKINSEFKPTVLLLKIGLVLYPTHGERLGK